MVFGPLLAMYAEMALRKVSIQANTTGTLAGEGALEDLVAVNTMAPTSFACVARGRIFDVDIDVVVVVGKGGGDVSKWCEEGGTLWAFFVFCKGVREIDLPTR